MLQIIRRKAFWTLDFIKGSKIRRHYNDIANKLENYNTDVVQTSIKNSLNNLLQHASSTTPFYKDFANYNSLQDFPLINKNMIRENYELFKSEKYLTSENIPVVTSGSTGTPFKLFHNKDKRFRNTADVIYFSKMAGFQIGSRLFYMKVWNEINKKSPLKRWMENIVPHSIYSYENSDFEDLILKMQADKNKKVLVGFSSTFELLCNYLDGLNSEPLDCNVVSIIANSEALDYGTKKRMEYYFGVPAISRYSNMENGMLAQQSIHGGTDFHINWASFHIEVLDMNEDKPANFGEPGRVVITDLYNYCMPMIRYENGDIAVMNKEDGQAPVLSHIEGRKVDMLYNTQGKLVTSHIVTVNMWKYDELKQYQFIQKGAKDYTFKLNPKGENFSREQELINEFKGYLGQDATITIEYVHDIPLLNSGKRKLVVSNYTKS